MMGAGQPLGGGVRVLPAARAVFTALLALVALAAGLAAPAHAQQTFATIVVEGNQRIDPETVIKFSGLRPGQAVSDAALNDAFQRVTASGLFSTVALVPSGNRLIIRVIENPIINAVSFEGNARVKDEDLTALIKSQPRRIYTPAQVEADAALITQGYADISRLAARVEPRVIDRGDNRVDLVFEIREGRITEVERLAFTGNRAYSDRRLRQVLATKQAGLLRAILQGDTFIPDRIEFDKQLLTDFYQSRGYIDARVLGTSSEFSRERDAFFLTFQIQEGLRYRINRVSTVSDYVGVDAADYQDQMRVRPGQYYSPNAIDNTITRMEAVALRQGVDFLAVDPVITRNRADQTLDVQFVLRRGPRVFIERIDIQGNATTLDKVIRRQFRVVEGDPLNPREIRNAAERIRALNFFETAEVNTKPGTAGDQVIVDVQVKEQPTGSLTFGASYSVSNGVGFNVGLTESNFLGRGQFVGANLAIGTDNQNSSITFVEPAFLGRDLRFRFTGFYITSNDDNADYDSRRIGVSPSIEFPIRDFTRLELRYKIASDKLSGVDPAQSSQLLVKDEARGSEIASSVGYTLSYDTRVGGLDPNTGIRLSFGQDLAGVGGDISMLTTNAVATYQTKVFNEEVTLRAEIEGGAAIGIGEDTRLLDRFFGNGKIRGFQPNGIGPRDLSVPNEDTVGGNYFAVARFEAEFPLGLPEEYGISGGLFADVGSVWGLDDTLGGSIDDGLDIRSAVGFSVFWTTALGPLRFNFSKAIKKRGFDEEQSFDLTVSTRF